MLDILSGPVYIVVAIIAVILIMAVIGYFLEKAKIEKENKERIVVVSDNNTTEEPIEITVPIVEEPVAKIELAPIVPPPVMEMVNEEPEVVNVIDFSETTTNPVEPSPIVETVTVPDTLPKFIAPMSDGSDSEEKPIELD